jgi:aerobic-type carbon monoxide dehydrogenase small subunit (CoxS/CutS family)
MAEDQNKENVSKISRREFLKDAGLVVGGATIGSMAFLNACGGESKTVTETVTKTTGSNSTVTVTGPTVTTTVSGESQDSPVINLTINSKPYYAYVEPNWTLRYLLHDKLGLIGVKDMCAGHGQCGTCSVIINGRPVLSCMILACECNGAVIETAEGIGQAQHPLVDAYINNECMQCGYCTPGFLVTAKALLDRNNNPTKDEIKEALAGNLCRCGTYPQHPIAVLEAAAVLRGS